MLPLFYLIKRNAEVHFRTNIFEYLRKKYLNQLYTCTFILSTQIFYFYNNVHRRWKNLCVQKYFWKINSDLYLFQNACQAPLVQIAPLYVLFQHMVKNAKTYATVTTKPAMLLQDVQPKPQVLSFATWIIKIFYFTMNHISNE